MSSNSDMSGKKRARTEDMIFSASSSSGMNSMKGGETSALQDLAPFDANKRAMALSNKISSFYSEFPEMKYIIDSQKLHAGVDDAVKKYKDDMIELSKAEEAKKRMEEEKKNRAQASVPLYSLPDEVLQNCLSYVGKGHYGLVALASKKLRKAYIAVFGKETKYLEIATSIKLVNYCLKNLYTTAEEKDEIFKAAAVNGNLDILRHAVSQGYDLFPLVEMKSDTVYEHEDGTFGVYDDEWHGRYSEWRLEEISKEVYFTDEDREDSWCVKKKVKLSQLVPRGHLHILKYLYEELNFSVGLQRYCRPAIQYGNVEIMELLDSIGCLNPNDAMHKFYLDKSDCRSLGDYRPLNFCSFAVKCGSVEALEWLLDKDFEFEFEFDSPVMKDAIRSKSVGMIQFCFDLGYNFEAGGVEEAIQGTKNLDVYRTVHELGYVFKKMSNWYDASRPKDAFEIIKFLRSVSIPWEEQVIRDFVQYGTLEMVQFAHENGCPWSSSGVIYALLCRNDFSHEKFSYLMEIGCKIEYDRSVVDSLRGKNDLDLLEIFVGKNSTFDNALFKSMVECDGRVYSTPPWLEGFTFVLDNGKNIQNFQSIEEVFEICRTIDGLKYFHSLGFPWCLDTSRNNRLLSGIACYNNLDDVKWAYENGCNGGLSVKEEHIKEDHIKHEFFDSSKREKWNANRIFFLENGLLYIEMNIPEKEIVQLEAKYSSRDSMFFTIDYSMLKSLVERGYGFRSQSEKKRITKKALEKCMNRFVSNNANERKRLSLFQKMGVNQSSSSN